MALRALARAGGLAVALPALAAILFGSGCLVQRLCHTDTDCPGNESCNPGSFMCELQCTSDQECLQSGRLCIENRCVLPPNRVKAQSFCLKVENPKATQYFNKQLCLADLQGKVVLLFFGYTLA